MGQARKQVLTEALARVSAPGELVQAVSEALGVSEEIAERALDEVLDENLLGMALASKAIGNVARSSRDEVDPFVGIAREISDTRKGNRYTKLRKRTNQGLAKKRGREISGRPLRAIDFNRDRKKKVIGRYDRFKKHMQKQGVKKLAGKIVSAAKRGMKMVFGKWQKVEAIEMRRELDRLESTPSLFPEAREQRIGQLRKALRESNPPMASAYDNATPPAGAIIIRHGSYEGWVSRSGFYLMYDDLDHVLEAKSKEDAVKLYAILSKDKKALVGIHKHEQYHADPSKRKPGMREWLESKGIDYYFTKGYH